MLTIIIIGVIVHSNISHRLVLEAVIIIKHYITIQLVPLTTYWLVLM